MIDALLYAARDYIRSLKIGYGYAECEVMESGEPPPRCGNFFAAVHEGDTRTGATDNNLQEYFGFSVTLTMRVTVALDRVGDQQIARNVPLTLNNIPLAQRQGFNAKREQLRSILHMNWGMTVLTGQSPNSANDNIIAWATGTVYGFCEPARYRGPERARLVGGEWFGAEPDAEDVGIVSELRFDGARRFQPQTASVGPFV